MSGGLNITVDSVTPGSNQVSFSITNIASGDASLRVDFYSDSGFTDRFRQGSAFTSTNNTTITRNETSVLSGKSVTSYVYWRLVDDTTEGMIDSGSVTIPAAFSSVGGRTMTVLIESITTNSITVSYQGNLASIPNKGVGFNVSSTPGYTDFQTLPSDQFFIRATAGVSSVSGTKTFSGLQQGTSYTVKSYILIANSSDLSQLQTVEGFASVTVNTPSLIPTASLNFLCDTTKVAMTATSTTPGAGDLRIYYTVYSNSSMTDQVSTNHPTGGILLTDGGTDTWNRDYVVSGGTTFEPGHTYYVKLANHADDTVLATGQFTVPHYTTKVFKEWLKNGVAYDFSTPVTENFTLVGSWSEAYDVTFKDYDDTVITTQTVVQGSAYGLIMPADPTRTGYTFAGWECSLDGHIWNNASESVISEMTLKATYTQN